MPDPVRPQDRKPIDRREAVRRTALILGGAISAPTLAGLLAGCDRPSNVSAAGWQAQTLTGGREELVATIGEHIIPTTDTPGARAARVDEFIDIMLSEYYPAEPRERFLAGLDRVDARARRRFGAPFLELEDDQQLELVTEMNRLAFEELPADIAVRPREPAVHQQHAETGRLRDEAEVPAEVLDDEDAWDPDDVGRQAFFRTLKELVLVGYYTSEVGATEELRLMPMGVYRADVPYDEIGRAWT